MDRKLAKCLEDLKYYHVRLARSVGHPGLGLNLVTASEREMLRCSGRPHLAASPDA